MIKKGAIPITNNRRRVGNALMVAGGAIQENGRLKGCQTGKKAGLSGGEKQKGK